LELRYCLDPCLVLTWNLAIGLNYLVMRHEILGFVWFELGLMSVANNVVVLELLLGYELALDVLGIVFGYKVEPPEDELGMVLE